MGLLWCVRFATFLRCLACDQQAFREDVREHLSEVWVLTVANYLEDAISRPLGLDMSAKTVLRSGERAWLKRISKK